MNKFWKWMEEKGYGSYEHKYIYSVDNTYSIDVTKQMLVGYMMEFLQNRGLCYNEMIPEVVQKFKFVEIDGIYNWLQNKIENLESEI